MNSVSLFLRSSWKAKTFSPKAFVLRAMLLSLLFGLSRLLGLQEYTTFLSGTSANPDLGWQTAAILGCIHLLLYVGFILLVPISLLTAGLLAAWAYWKARPEPET